MTDKVHRIRKRGRELHVMTDKVHRILCQCSDKTGKHICPVEFHAVKCTPSSLFKTKAYLSFPTICSRLPLNLEQNQKFENRLGPDYYHRLLHIVCGNTFTWAVISNKEKVCAFYCMKIDWVLSTI